MGKQKARKASVGTNTQRQTVRRRIACVFPHHNRGIQIFRESDVVDGKWQTEPQSDHSIVVPQGVSDEEALIEYFEKRVDPIPGLNPQTMLRLIESVVREMIRDMLLYLSRNGLFWKIFREFQKALLAQTAMRRGDATRRDRKQPKQQRGRAAPRPAYG